MKIELDTAERPLGLDLRRRRLVLGIPGGIALASPLALVACGGGGGHDDGSSDDGGDTVDLHDPGRAFVGDGTFAPIAVTVALPAGASVPEGKMAVHTVIGGFGVVSGGTTTLDVAFGGVQLATVYSRDGLPVLYGWVDAGLTTIDAHSTAAVLLANGIGAPVFDDVLGRQWIVEIAASPAATTLGDAIATALAADIYALAAFGPGLQTALLDATRTLLAAAGRSLPMAGHVRPLGVTIDPPNAASGVQPIIAETFNTVYVQNEKLRRASWVIHRESSVDASGTTVKEPGRTLVAFGDIPLLPAFSSAGGIIAAVTQAVYADDKTGLAFSKTPETALTLKPEGAKSTTYSVTVLMAGNEKLGFDRSAAAEVLTSDELDMVDISRFSQSHLGLQMLLMDFLVPLAFSWLGGKVSAASGGLGPREYKQKLQAALLGDLIKVLQTQLPTIVNKLMNPLQFPDYGTLGALKDIVQNELVTTYDLEVPGRAEPVKIAVLTKFSISLLTLMLKFIAYEKLNTKDGEDLLTFLEGTGNNDKVDTRYTWVTGTSGGKEQRIDFDMARIDHAGIGVAMKALGTVDAGLGWINQGRMGFDIGSSKLYETWQVTVVKPNIKLTPNPLKIDKLGVSYPIKAEIVDNDNDEYGNEKGSFRFDWTCSAQYGDLYKPDTGGGPGSRETNTFSTSNANATPDYMARTLASPDDPEETITIDAWFEPVGSKPAVKIGSAKAKLEFKQEFTVSIGPKTGAKLPQNIDMPIQGFLNETPPADASVEWEWTHAGVGTLTSPPTDGKNRQHFVTLSTGGTDGFVTLGLKATIRIPATSTAAGRTVITKPVSVSYSVEKALKTVTFECAGGVFPCDAGCGVSDYTAFIVPKIAGALRYSGVFSGFGYPSCNRTVTWTTEVGDGGGCSFPITQHPRSQGAAARAWAVWIGFGGPLTEGKFVATITLPA